MPLVDPNAVINQAQWQRLQWLSFSDTIAANNASGNDTVSISEDGHFECMYIGGQFTSLTAQDTDGGACGISVKLTDNGRRWEIFDNLVPMSLFCSPGRQRASGVAGDPSNPLFVPLEFYYPFKAGSTIQVEYANSLAYANTFWLIFYGQKIFRDNPRFEDMAK